MAWNPNIPTVTNRVQDDLNAIRENFQHLDPLAQAVGELQTVSGLAPITDDMQVVSELAPYVQAILDSRIVEMGSNSNGHYVRWENGLQVCWTIGTATKGSGRYTTRLEFDWTLPAAFLNASSYIVGGTLNNDAQVWANEPERRRMGGAMCNGVSASWASMVFWRTDDVEPTTTSVPGCLFWAIGRWKS